MHTDTKQHVIFNLSDELYAIDISFVEVIEHLLPITRVPKCEKYILGVINLRGEIIPVVDVRVKFDMTKKDTTDETRIMVLTLDDLKYSILVDEVKEVEDIAEFDMQNSKDVVGEMAQECVAGFGKVNGRVVTLLSPEKLLKYEKGD